MHLDRRDYVKSLGAAGLAGLGASASAGQVSAASVGAGSYTTTKPSGETEPQAAQYVTSDVSAPIQTNEWWSSVLWSGYGDNIFWHPGYGFPTDAGLEVGYPNSWNFPAADAKLAVTRDFTIEHSGASSFADCRVSGWSDWSVDLTFGAGNESAQSNSVTVTTDSSGSSDFTQTVTRIDGSDSDSTTDELEFTFTSNVSSSWVDVHYTVNGGTQYNYRMNNPSGDTHTLTTPASVVGDFSSGDVIRYYYTYEDGGTATDTDWFEVTF